PFVLVALAGFLCLAVLLGYPNWVLANDASDRRHPSYSLIGRDAPPTSPLNPNFVVAEEARLSESGFWRSAYIPGNLVGVAVQDIDNDGRNEIVYATDKIVYVGRISSSKLVQLASFNVERTERIISIDALDLTNNGQMEIIVSIQNDRSAAASVILNFDGSSLTPAHSSRLGWYLRVVGPQGARFLAGQRSATTAREFYSGRVMRMNFNGSALRADGAVPLPRFVNLYNFTMGNLGSSRTQMTAAIRFPSEHIFLYEGGRDRAWESREEYGGTMIHLTPFLPSGDTQGAGREFIPARMIIFDIDGDGQNELIVAKNDRGGAAFMSNLRSFTSGAVQAFKYANMSLTPFFRTRTLPGPAVDIQVADLNNNGRLDLVAAVVVEQGSGMLRQGRSVIVAYEIGVNN
ncbi:MAG: FG-GAP repeat domain-containing protein, partial [Candidatus Adiutrix sp.]